MRYSSQGTCVGVITNTTELSDAIRDGAFSLPTEQEIRDRSKGDSLSKALAAGQAGWFVAQCVSRLVKGLAVSQIEVVTLALAALNGIIYFLWWDKPLNVRCHVRVIIGPNTGRPLSSFIGMPIHQCILLYNLAPEGSIVYSCLWDPGDDLQNYYRWFLRSRIGKLLTRLRTPIRYFNNQEQYPATEDRPVNISIFHSSCESVDTTTATAAAAAIGTLFGAVHCVAWRFRFLTSPERTLWQIWSIITISMPFVLCVKSTVGFITVRHSIYSMERAAYMPTRTSGRGVREVIMRRVMLPVNWLSLRVTVTLLPLYVVARIGLLAQALAALRGLQPLERTEVKWVTLIPHL